jgi:hypothetical protein
MAASIDREIDAGTASEVFGIAVLPFILDHRCFAWNKFIENHIHRNKRLGLSVVINET